MLHRFLLVSSENGSQPVTGAQPAVTILPPGDGDWTLIDADKVKELGRGWYHADLGDWSGGERLIVNASAAGALDWRDLVDLDRANLAAAVEASNAAAQASSAAEEAQRIAAAAQASAALSLETATATANEALALLREIQNDDDLVIPSRPEIVAKNPVAWSFHDPGNAFTRQNVAGGVELTCNQVASEPVQLYDYGYALAAGQYQLDIEVEGTAGATFRFQVLQHDRPYYGLGKSSDMIVGEDGKQVLNLKNDNKARLRLWFTDLAKPGDKYLIKRISLKQI